eukprot:g28738.t1
MSSKASSASVSIKACGHTGGNCLVAELDFDEGEVVLEETPLLEMPGSQGLSEGAASSCKAEDLKRALEAEVPCSQNDDALRFLVTQLQAGIFAAQAAVHLKVILMSNSFRFKGVNGKTTALFEIMQKYLSEHWGFQCKCVRCEREASIRTS